MQANCVSSKCILQGLRILCRETQRCFLWWCGRCPHWGQWSWLFLRAWDGVRGACGGATMGVKVLMGCASMGIWMGGTNLGVQIGSNGPSSSSMESWRCVIVLERIKMGVVDVLRIEWCWMMIGILQVSSSGILRVGPQWKRRVSGSWSRRGKIDPTYVCAMCIEMYILNIADRHQIRVME